MTHTEINMAARARQVAISRKLGPSAHRKWHCPMLHGTVVVATTKSEARAVLKREMGWQRLPAGILIHEIA